MPVIPPLSLPQTEIGFSYNPQVNRPIPSSKTSLVKTRLSTKTFLVKMNFNCMRIKNYFYINSFALSLALRQRLGANRKWPIQLQAPVSVAKARKKTVSLINLVTLPFS